MYMLSIMLKTLEETDESGAVDLINSQNLPKILVWITNYTVCSK